MATTRKLVTFDVSQGMSQEFPQWVGIEWFYLNNFRPKNGYLEQIPRLKSLSEFNRGNSGQASGIEQYFNGENNGYFLIAQIPKFITATGIVSTIPVIHRSSSPSTVLDAHAECLLYGLNLTDFSAVNDIWTVTVTSGTTITVAKNSETPSAPLTITNGMSISSNGLKLAFLETSGFTIGTTWQWIRRDGLYFIDVDSIPHSSYTTMYKADAYFSYYNSIYRLRNGIIGQVGYRSLRGRYVTVFQNHLVVGGASTQGDRINPDDMVYTVAWSHLNDPDQFYSTDLNEADQYSIPRNVYDAGSALGITGLEVLGKACFIYTADGIYEMQYVGLPTVMQVLPFYEGYGCAYPSSLVATPSGHYFITRDNICFFDGVTVTVIGNPIQQQLFYELPKLSSPLEANRVFGHFNSYEREVIWTYYSNGGINRAIVYNEKQKKWYFRDMFTKSINSRITGMTQKQNDTKYNVIHAVDNSDEITMVESIFIIGGLEVQDLPSTAYKFSRPEAIGKYTDFGYPFQVKEIDNVKISMSQQSGTSIQVQETHITTEVVIVNNSASFTKVGDVVSRSNQVLSFPRVACEKFALKLVDVATDPVQVTKGVVIHSLGVEIIDPKVDDER